MWLQLFAFQNHPSSPAIKCTKLHISLPFLQDQTAKDRGHPPKIDHLMEHPAPHFGLQEFASPPKSADEFDACA